MGAGTTNKQFAGNLASRQAANRPSSFPGRGLEEGRRFGPPGGLTSPERGPVQGFPPGMGEGISSFPGRGFEQGQRFGPPGGLTSLGRRPEPNFPSFPGGPMQQEFAPGLEANPSPPGRPGQQSRLPQIEQLMQRKGSPEYEQLLQRVRGMNAMKNTGSRF